MSVKEILGYICLAAAAGLFVTMYFMPRINRRKNPGKTKGEERLIRIEERTSLMIPLQLILIGAVLLT